MRIDGNAIELLARAHERHAARLDGALDLLADVGMSNHLGDTDEGRIVTTNYRASAVTSERSLRAAVSRQQQVSLAIADRLRNTQRLVTTQDAHGAAAIDPLTP